MSFLWSGALAGLAVVALLAAGYAWGAFRPSPAPIAHSLTPLLARASAASCVLCRHAPAALFLVALAALVVALARPVVPWPAPRGWPVALVIDVSRSMEETDIPPSRIAAARTAAAEFVRGLPGSTPAALVTFGNYASVVVPLTTDRGRLLGGIENLTTQLRTQLGNGLLEGVRVLVGESPPASPPGGSLPPAPPGPGPRSTAPRAVVVLLSDGRASDGFSPLEAAGIARERNVRVYTVGMGTVGDPTQFRSGYWGILDEPTLRAMADATGGAYFHAASAGRLRNVYRDLARIVGWARAPQEVSAVVALAALFAAVTAVTLHLRYRPLA